MRDIEIGLRIGLYLIIAVCLGAHMVPVRAAVPEILQKNQTQEEKLDTNDSHVVCQDTKEERFLLHKDGSFDIVSITTPHCKSGGE